MSLDKGQMPDIDVSNLKIAVVASRFNKELVDALVGDAVKCMLAKGLKAENVKAVRVPGAAELPFMCEMLSSTKQYDSVIALGVVIAGETPHHEIIANSTANALQSIAVQTKTPMINGIVVTNNLQQAQDRTIGPIARGSEFAEAAMEMGFYNKNLRKELGA